MDKALIKRVREMDREFLGKIHTEEDGEWSKS